MKRLILILIVSLFSVGMAHAKDVSLSWDPSPSEIEGYKVYYSATNELPFTGTDGDQNTPIDVGSALMTVVTGLPDEVGYYFAVTAYDQFDNESVYSNVVYSPGVTMPEPPTSLGGVTTINNIDIPLD